MSRPPFKATAPTLELDINDDEIGGSYGNPDLDPYESDNFDLSIEYYGDDLFYISIGTFLKDIDNAIYKTIQKLPLLMAFHSTMVLILGLMLTLLRSEDMS
ncbi:MAG: hypothetical protein CM15mP127_02300 [Gammaproteobacteria bacterium]|nr:MAG: hypothetical protein CM15mP127_02300 [Gammaproteobacteria bacterium]